MDDQIKNRIKQIVSAYKRAYPEEYKGVCEMVAVKRTMTWDEFASLEGLKETRALFEISETLQTMFIQDLNEEETKQFTTIQGSRWFAKTFPEFALPQKI